MISLASWRSPKTAAPAAAVKAPVPPQGFEVGTVASNHLAGTVIELKRDGKPFALIDPAKLVAIGSPALGTEVWVLVKDAPKKGKPNRRVVEDIKLKM
jgi:hypothetical protein